MATISIKHIFWLLVKADHARYGGACQLPLRFAYSAGISALAQMHAILKVGLDCFEGPKEMITASQVNPIPGLTPFSGPHQS